MKNKLTEETDKQIKTNKQTKNKQSQKESKTNKATKQTNTNKQTKDKQIIKRPRDITNKIFYLLFLQDGGKEGSRTKERRKVL